MKVLRTFFQSFPDFTKIILLNYIFLLIYRLTEVTLTLMNGNPLDFAEIMVFGLSGDLVILNISLAGCYVVFRLLHWWNPAIARLIITTFSLLFFVFILFPLQYYTYNSQIITFTGFDCSFTLTVSSLFSGISIFPWIIITLILVSVFAWFLFHPFPLQVRVPGVLSKFLALIMLLSIILFFELRFQTDYLDRNETRLNKGFHFTGSLCDCIFYGGKEKELTGMDLFLNITGREELKFIDHPLADTFKETDCLGQYINRTDDGLPPDIIFIVMEGLGDEFIHTFHGFEFMPFPGKLSSEGLYWSRFLSTSDDGRAVLPSLLGSLPHGNSGFTELGRIPYHFSLINILNRNEYHTSLYYSRWAWEFSQRKFLEQNNIDLIWDAGDFPDQYQKIFIGEGKFHWGYNDMDLYSCYFDKISEIKSRPRLDIVYPVSARAPFAVGNKEYYDKKYDQLIAGVTNTAQKEYFIEMEGYFKALMYSNDALEHFFKEYSSQPNFRNTIFIITGSYPTPDFATPDPFRKYHVPLIFWSPLIKENKVFNKISSHKDIYNTLLSYLSSEYDFNVPDVSATLGYSLCNQGISGQNLMIPFLSQEGRIKDVFYNNLFLSEGKTLYRVSENLAIEQIDEPDPVKKMKAVLDAYNMVNIQASAEIIPDSVYFSYFGYDVVIDTIMPLQRVRSEFKNIITRMPVQNKPHYLDLSLVKPDVGLDEVFVVFELSNDQDSIIQWKNLGIPTNREDFSLQIKTGDLDYDEQLYLQLYIWNESPIPYNFHKLRATLYREAIPETE
jgi:hypothetical protein